MGMTGQRIVLGLPTQAIRRAKKLRCDIATSETYLANGGYPANWKEISNAVKERANWQCEWINADGTRCERKHHEPIPNNPYRKTVLTVAHLNHIASDCRMENLRAWCQAHHLRYDAKMHAQHAQETLRRKRYDEALQAGQVPLFEKN